MTVVIGYVVPGEGAALACDSRVLLGHEIVSDDCPKFVLAGSAVALVSGNDGGLMQAIDGARNFEGVRLLAAEYGAANPNLNWDLLCYERRTESLIDYDSDGCSLAVGQWACRGAGAPYAIGVLASSPVPRTLDAAAKLVRRAVTLTIKHTAACGGRVRVLVVRGKRAPVEIS